MAQKLYVVIATHNRPLSLERSLDSLNRCKKPNIYQQTIVVENGAQDLGNIEHRWESLRLRYLHFPFANKSLAINLALRELPSEALVYFTDDDVRVSSEILVHYARAAQKHTEGVFFGGPTGVEYDLRPPQWLLRYFPASAKGWTLELPKENKRLAENCFLGFNWAGFVGDIRKVGSFHPKLGPGSRTLAPGQESELQQRLVKAGIMKLYLPLAKVWHHVPQHHCTKKWILHRAYREGTRKGLFLPFPQSAIFPPIWLQKYWLYRFWQYLKHQWFIYPRMKETIRFNTAFQFFIAHGVMRGWWLQKSSQFKPQKFQSEGTEGTVIKSSFSTST